MKLSFYNLIALAATAFLFITFGIVGCDKSTSRIAPPLTCVNAHLSRYDSICNMGGVRPSFEHHVQYEYDSGKLKSVLTHDTANIYFQVYVAPDKSITYLNNSFQIIDTTNGLIHFANYTIPTDNEINIFYFPVQDSFVISTKSNIYQPQVTKTDYDTLFSYW